MQPSLLTSTFGADGRAPVCVTLTCVATLVARRAAEVVARAAAFDHHGAARQIVVRLLFDRIGYVQVTARQH